ncbi:MAG: hypothetical protein U0228_09650 [Myxococcaceae bacterium]
MDTRPWTLSKPGPLTKRADGLYTVDDVLPGSRPIHRRMTVLVHDGGVVFFNAIPVPDETLKELAALGTPRALVIPNQYHSLDAVPFSQKLGVTPYGTAATIEALKDRVKLEPIAHAPLGDAKLITVTGFKTQEANLVAKKSLIAADLVTNVEHQPGFGGFIMRLIGFTGPEPKLPRPVRARVQRDAAAVKSLMTELSALNLERIIPSHGRVFEGDVGAALRRIADSL